MGHSSASHACIFFNSLVVKEEISDDNAKLPCFNGRVVSWVSKPFASVSRCPFLLSLKTTLWLHSAK
ncbi:hypothetical protein QYF61_020517 [Mycteria americana]|uniref:DIX domain-containing protein n=1 Tax=Mycteria americana TaxID=33587 RepID=A0AAN7RWX3_MYCAM|nr:hypothetical protein QYF61_020517 [Mycteria americana]